MLAQRILVYGVTGSGKTTAALRIAERYGRTPTLVDELSWEPGWRQVDTATQRERIAEITEQDEWLLDSAYGQWLDLVLPRAQLVIGLDYPRWRSLGRLLRRTTMRMVDRQPICNGNVETLRSTLSSESIIVWHFRSFTRKRARMRAWANDPTAPRTLLFRTPREFEHWLERGSGLE